MFDRMTVNKDQLMHLRIALIVALSVTATATALAQDLQRHISVSGAGRIEVAPDMADISLGVRHQARTAQEALRDTSAAVAAIIQRVQSFGVDEADIQTTGLSLNPIYERRSNSEQQPRLAGFAASNMITVRVRDLDRLGGLIDRVVDAGATNFQGLRFGLSDRAEALEDARRAAVADAMARAQVYADAAGVTLEEVLSIVESGAQIQPRAMMRVESMALDSVPIAAGELTISANVSLTFGLN